MSVSQDTLDLYSTIQNTNLNQSDFNVSEIDITKNKTPQDFFKMTFLFLVNHWDDLLMVVLTLSIVMIYMSIYGIDLNMDYIKKNVKKSKIRKIVYDGKANTSRKKTQIEHTGVNIPNHVPVPDTSEFQYE